MSVEKPKAQTSKINTNNKTQSNNNQNNDAKSDAKITNLAQDVEKVLAIVANIATSNRNNSGGSLSGNQKDSFKLQGGESEHDKSREQREYEALSKEDQQKIKDEENVRNKENADPNIEIILKIVTELAISQNTLIEYLEANKTTNSSQDLKSLKINVEE